VAEAPRTDLSGRKIGEYEVIARIGVGGMGEVYEGRQPLIGKRVAVKVLLPSLSNEKELVERFLAEARAVNEIRHRGIVDIFSFGQLPDGAHYFVMEYLEGVAFDRLIKQRGPLPIAEALSYIEEVLDALDSAHAAGIVHRDIKPSNIFLVNTGRGKAYVKLLDFGIAKLGALANGSDSAPQTRASMILGTPDYISPEQARGKPVSAATDLYALGVVLFEMVTGKRPFKGENTLQTMWMHVEDTPPVPSSLRPDIPPALDELILWAMEKDPANRPASAEELRSHLDAIRASLLPGTGTTTPAPITGRTPSIQSVATPSGRQRPLAGTPPPRSGSQKPLGSTSGRQSRVQARPAVPVEAGQETRMAPLTAELGTSIENETRGAIPKPVLPVVADEVRTDPERGAVPRPTESDLEVVPDAPKSRLPLVIGGVSVVAIVIGVAVLVGSGKSEPAPEPGKVIAVSPAPAAPVEAAPAATKPPEPAPTPAPPVAVTPPEPAPPVAVVPPQPTTTPDPPKPPEAVKPTEVKKPPPPAAAKGITQAQLEARLARVKAKLEKREADMGEPDTMLRKFLSPAEAAVRSAKDDADRKDAWSQLADLEQQLR
jgi:serine/threonine protein kinase